MKRRCGDAAPVSPSARDGWLVTHFWIVPAPRWAWLHCQCLWTWRVTAFLSLLWLGYPGQLCCFKSRAARGMRQVGLPAGLWGRQGASRRALEASVVSLNILFLMSWKLSLLRKHSSLLGLLSPKKSSQRCILLEVHGSVAENANWSSCGHGFLLAFLVSCCLNPWGMTVTKFSPLRAGQRGNCPDRQCTTPGWCSLLETSVRKLHSYNFLGPDTCMWCSVQPSLCSQKGLCWKLFWKWSHGGLWFDVYSQLGLPHAAWRQWLPLSQGCCSKFLTSLCERRCLGKVWRV